MRVEAARVDIDTITNTGFSTGTVYGFTALMAGWAPPMTLPWSANLLLLAGWVLLLWRENADAAMVLGIAAALLGLTSLIFIPTDELLVGYYLWQLSLVLFARGSFAIWRRPDSEEAEL